MVKPMTKNSMLINLKLRATRFVISALFVALVLTPGRRATAAETSPERIIGVDASAVQGPLATSFKECIGAGRANEGLRADWQAQLRETQRECGFKYIRMHGLLSDDMGVYQEDKQGNAIYNWQYIDQLYDFLLSIHIKPFVELSFMPKALASGSKTIFWWNANVTPPKSYDKWGELIRQLTLHFQERYGQAEVKTWYFEVWNEPDLHDIFFTGDRADYFKLYAVTAQAIKSVSPEFRVGGPATAMGQFDEPFINFCHSNRVPVDFISSHAYGVSGGFMDETGQRGTVLDPNTNSVIGRMVGERQMIDRSPLPGLPLHFTEWSSSYTPTDFMHDTYQQAAFILSKVKGSYQSVNSMSYWVFTDIFEENGPRMTPFHGGFGLINYEDLKKPAYYAFKFLNELGASELVNADAASWVCKSPAGSVQALLWDYTPIVPPPGMNDQQFFRKEIPAQEIGPVTLRISNLPAGTYSVEFYQTGYRTNDLLTSYIDLKSPSQLTRDQVALLAEKSSGKPESVETVEVTAGKPWERVFPLRQNDVYFIKLVPVVLK